MTKTGADLLVETLVEAGVNYLFSLSGNHILSIYDATIERDIALIHTRHEATAVHMADSWGRLTEQPGVALVTGGPGHANALSALYVASMAESPVVLLSGHAPLNLLGKGSFQEVDQVAMAKPVCKGAWLVEDPARLAAEIRAALVLACSGRPGPVHLSLPTDVLEATIQDDASDDVDVNAVKPEKTQAAASPIWPPLSEGVIDEILAALAAAEHPLILAGPAMGRPARWSAVARLAGMMGIPALPMESPRGVNDPWLHMASQRLAEADVVLLVGKKLDFSLRFGQPPAFQSGCRFIQIEADQAHLRETEAVVYLAVHNDPAQVVKQLILGVEKGTRFRSRPAEIWAAEVEAARHSVPETWSSLRQATKPPIHPLRVCEALQPFLDEGAIFVSDGGEFGQWVQAGLTAQTRLINGPAGSIGSALPLALAAKLAHPERVVFALLGDGAFGFHAMELDTALRYELPIIVIVGNDGRWNAEHQLQLRHYGPDRTVGCDLLPTRYDQMAAALGGHGEFVDHPDALQPALERAIASDLPACVNVMIDSVAAPTF